MKRSRALSTGRTRPSCVSECGTPSFDGAGGGVSAGGFAACVPAGGATAPAAPGASSGAGSSGCASQSPTSLLLRLLERWSAAASSPAASNSPATSPLASSSSAATSSAAASPAASSPAGLASPGWAGGGPAAPRCAAWVMNSGGVSAGLAARRRPEGSGEIGGASIHSPPAALRRSRSRPFSWYRSLKACCKRSCSATRSAACSWKDMGVTGVDICYPPERRGIQRGGSLSCSGAQTRRPP
mmetsp:Transcript_87862/g.243725  ORF Transcript_87862/g.243725 Transcript_87862/m.243725 type:complete len:242 (-) Transcript_87862:14-739(-)